MKLFKDIFKPKVKLNEYTVHDIDYDDSDARLVFSLERLTYVIDLEWDNENMDIEFGILFDKSHDTTDQHIPYQVVNTVYSIVNDMMKKINDTTGIKFKSVSFNSSDIKNGIKDIRGKEIRDRFFIRRISRDYPKAIRIEDNNGNLFINLYGL